jgi:glycosyltransferase involved in cell wall biosynthesis
LKKLLLISPVPIEMGGNGSYTTGVANVVAEIADGLSKNTRVSYYGTNLPSKKSTKIVSNVTYIGYKKFIFSVLKYAELVRLWGISKELGFGFFRLVFYYINLKNILKNESYDIIHIHNVIFLPILDLIDKNIKVVITYHGNFYKNQNAINFNKKNGVSLELLYSNTVKYVVNATFLTPSMRLEYKNDLGLTPSIAKVIPNGVDTDLFSYNKLSREKFRAKISIKNSDLLLITVGSIQERKGQERFVRLIDKYKLNIKYLIIGTGPDSLKVKSLVSNLNMSDKVTVIDYVENNKLPNYYNAADIYAHVSSAEGQAMTSIEALSCGLKLIISKDIIQTMGCYSSNDSLTINFNSFDKATFQGFCAQVAGNALARESFNNEDYSWENVTNLYDSLYNEI